MEVREIKALITLMNEYGLVELEIEDKKGKIRLVRGADAGSAAPIAVPGAGRPAAAARKGPTRGEGAAGVTAPEVVGAKAPIELGPNQKLVESPMVGTFYRSSSPGGPPFVEEGSSVRKGQTLCIIEAMKMMNEIESQFGGRVVRILCNNGQAVEYGQALFVIEVG